MNSTQLNLEIVTPMFLRGSNNMTPELRPPAFKALFRYWWRAAIVETNIDNLRQRESCLFGSTKGRSPVSIRISSGGALPPSATYTPLPHKPGNFQSQAYSPNGRFSLTLAAPVLSEYEKIATLGFLLGGIGNRSRRGFGSIRDRDWNFQDVDELKNKVYETLNSISPRQFNRNRHGIQINTTNPSANYDYPVILAIYFGTQLWDRVEDAGLLHRIGQSMHKHKHNALGSANPRMASPIHVRIQKVGTQFVPIVTQLHSVFPDTVPKDYEQKQLDFINAIIT